MKVHSVGDYELCFIGEAKDIAKAKELGIEHAVGSHIDSTECGIYVTSDGRRITVEVSPHATVSNL